MSAKGATPKVPAPPSGGREVERPRWNFWNAKKEFDFVQGTLAGIVQIKNQRGEERDRYTIMVDKELFVLPDHYDLQEKLAKVAKDNGNAVLGVFVWIQFLRKEKVENVPNPMAMYRVVDYGMEVPKR